MLSNVNATHPCDHSVEENCKLLINWNMVRWIDAEQLNGFAQKNKCTPIYTKLILNVLWMPTKQFFYPVWSGEGRCVIWSVGSMPGILIQQVLADGMGKELYYTKNSLHHSLYNIVF